MFPSRWRSLMRNPWVLGALSCMLVVGVMSLVAHYVWRSDIAAARSAFRQTIGDTTDEVEARVRVYEERIRILALMANSRGMEASRQAWAELGIAFQPAYDGTATSLTLLEYKPERVYPGLSLSAQAGPDFSARVVAINRDTQGNSLIGYDVAADSIRREALEAARDQGNVTVTSPVILARDSHTGAGSSFLLIAPVYAGSGVPTSVTERRMRIRGYVVAAYRMRELLSPVRSRLAQQIALTVADPSDGFTPLIYAETDTPNPNGMFQDRQGLQIADRIWLLTYQTLPEYELFLHRRHTVRIILAGLCLALLVGLLVWRLARSWRQAETRVHGVSDELRRYQALLHTVLDVMPQPVLVRDRHLRLLMANRAYADCMGMPISMLLGKEVSQYLPAKVAERLDEAGRAVLAGEGEQIFELAIPNRILREVRSHIVTARLAQDADGQPIMVGVHSDVTELRRAIAAFGAVIEQTPLVAVQGFSRNCVLTHWNKASENLFGYAAERALGSRLQDLILVPRMQRMFERMVEEAWIHQRTFGPREVGLRLPDGRSVHLLVTLFPVVLDGVVLELFSMAVDVSAQHEAECQLALHRDHLQRLVDERTGGLLRAKQDLEQALQARSEFLANMSHELRTPMHAVLSFAQLGEERALNAAPERLQEYFSRIAASGQRLLGLINNLLDLSKLEAGKMILTYRSTDLATLVGEVAAELEPLSEQQRLTLTLPVPGGVPEIEIDADRIRQVLSNLLSNAIRFSPVQGHIRITLAPWVMRSGRRATDTSEQAAVMLTISDEGPGIPASELELVFEKFVQSSSTRSGAGGTGLGLAICREIVLAHQGSIAAFNRAEGGTRFEVVLPCQAHEAGTD